MRKSSIAARGACAGAARARCNELPRFAEGGGRPERADRRHARTSCSPACRRTPSANQEGPVAMIICEWMQQCAGINGRFVDTQGDYTIDATTFDMPFQNIYNGGGLIGIRARSRRAPTPPATSCTRASPRCSRRWTSLLRRGHLGRHAVPRGGRQRTRRRTFEPQMQVYADLLALLDKAIADIGGRRHRARRARSRLRRQRRRSGSRPRTRSRRASTCTRSRSSATRSTRAR